MASNTFQVPITCPGGINPNNCSLTTATHTYKHDSAHVENETVAASNVITHLLPK